MSKKAGIVIVESDPREADRLVTALSPLGYAISVVDTGGMGIQKASEDGVNLILSGADLPDIDGLEFAERLRAGKSTGYILLAMHIPLATNTEREQAYKSGVDAVFRDTDDEAELCVRVQNLLIGAVSKDRLHYLEKAHAARTEKLERTVERLRKEINKRRRSERELRAYHQAVESTDDVVLVFDRNGIVRMANTACLNVFDISREDIEGQSLRSLFDDEVYEDTVELHMRGCLFGQPVEHELALSGDRGQRQFSMRYFPLRNTAGKTTRVVAVMHDITDSRNMEQVLRVAHWDSEQRVKERTRELEAANKRLLQEVEERVRAEAALRENEQRLELIIESLPLLIHAHDKDGNFIYWNKESERVLGYTAEEVRTDRNLRLRMYENQKRMQEVMDTYHSGALDFENVEVALLTSTGERKVISWTSRSSQVPIPGWYLWETGVDVTERKRTDEELRKLYLAVENSPSGILITDPDGVIEYVNPRAFQGTGYKSGELLGCPIENLAVSRGGLMKKLREQTNGFRKPWRGDVLGRRKSGHAFWAEVWVSSLTGEQGEVRKLIWIQSDITDRKLAERQLLRAKRLSEEANRAKSDFLARMSHEIRTPMNAILGMTEIVLQSRLDTEQRENLEIARDAAQGLLSIINDILDLSKIEARKMDMAKENFNLPGAVRSALDSLRIRADELGLRLSLEVEDGIPEFVRGDPARLRQILVNLIGNGLKFTSTGGVTVTLAPGEAGKPEFETNYSWVRIMVEDTGAGIPASALENIFEPFVQVRGEIPNPAKGTGLGLAVTRQLVDMLGGDISVRSEMGRGSAFTVTLPFALGSKEAVAAPVEPRQEEYRETVPKDVLLVEDNPENVRVVTKFLERMGHRCMVAGNGKEALSILSESRYDVVLMDLEMPVMDGLEATRRIRAGEAGPVAADIPIVAMTAHALAGFREQCFRAGMDRYMTKPLSFQDVSAVLASKNLREKREASADPVEKDPVDEKVLDCDGALRRLEGDKELYAEICGAFVESFPKRLEEFRQYLAGGGMEDAVRAIHTLKGNCGMVGAEICHSLASDLEQAARAGDLETIHQLFPRLEKELSRVRGHVAA